MRLRLMLIGLAACAHAQPVMAPAPPDEPTAGEPVVYVEHPRYVSLLPFGAGQFQNGEPGKGIAFAVAEGATAATSIGIFVYLVDRYGVHSNQVAVDEAEGVRRLERIEIVTGVAFFGLYAAGVIDALMHFQPRIRKSPVTLAPIPVEGGAGLGLAWSH